MTKEEEVRALAELREGVLLALAKGNKTAGKLREELFFNGGLLASKIAGGWNEEVAKMRLIDNELKKLKRAGKVVWRKEERKWALNSTEKGQ